MSDRTFNKPLPGHWDTTEGAEVASLIVDEKREHLTMGDMSDFHFANAQYLASRNDLDLIVYQTAAKERIRWLSAQLAQANYRLAALNQELFGADHPEASEPLQSATPRHAPVDLGPAAGAREEAGKPSEQLVPVTTEETVKWLEEACRNWDSVPYLSDGDVQDVCAQLNAIIRLRHATLTASIRAQALEEALAAVGRVEPEWDEATGHEGMTWRQFRQIALATISALKGGNL